MPVKISKIYLLCSLCLLRNVSLAEYELLYTSADGTQFFANLEEKHIIGNIVTVREFQNYPNKNIQGDSSMFAETEYDCHKRTSRHIRMSRFGGRNLTGDVNDSWLNIRNEWKPMKKNTIESLIFQNVCKVNG
jgi:hypothetical protein